MYDKQTYICGPSDNAFLYPYIYSTLSPIRILCIFGTRPEAIKFAPLIRELKQYPSAFQIITCVTAQHRSMLDQVMAFFELQADYDLDMMAPNQTLFDIVSRVMPGLSSVIESSNPDLIIVQGDTTTAFLGALAGYYSKVQVAHLEAGLRSGNKYAPWPEELNRVMISHLGDFHFAPTIGAMKHLNTEGITEQIHVTGNTVIDALHLALSIVEKRDYDVRNDFPGVDFTKRVILVTAHRRESFGGPFEHICAAIKEIALAYPDVQIVYPVHLNPNVREPVFRMLSELKNVFLTDPVDYPHLVWLLNNSYLVLTDSGGIQEEAPALGKPVLVLRDVTEREEGVEAGTAMLVGTNQELIVKEVKSLLTDQARYETMSNAVNPYGDGTASKKIAEIIMQHYQRQHA